jgi:hypothetical protein
MIALVRWKQPWLWRFCPRVRHFATVENARVVLHYEPELKRGDTIPAFLQACEKELENLMRWFGSPMRGRVTVYLFAHGQDIAAIYGSGYAGWAIFRANAIVLANYYHFPELLRHELAHLFAFRWSALAPPLLSEGIAVWLQGSYWGKSIDEEALTLLRQGSPKLSKLLRSRFFSAEARRYSCYILAGSFTGFLIRRYGWDRHRQLYRSCNGNHFAAKFEKCFGISLEKAEWHWRNEVLVMPILKRRLGRKPHC